MRVFRKILSLITAIVLCACSTAESLSNQECKNPQDLVLGCVMRENGILKREIPCKNGVANGIVKRYYKNHALQSVETYRDGKLNGEAIFYDESKNELAVIVYDDNAIQSGKCSNGREITNDMISSPKNDIYAIQKICLAKLTL